MHYFLIAGEASGDLHGSNLIKALKKEDPNNTFTCFGGDLMEAQGANVLKHYRELAFMGFIPVLLNIRTILKNMTFCKEEIIKEQPNALILIDYPGFNLKIAKYIHQHSKIPVYYYISPKVWAWKEYRVKSFKKYVDKMYCILPFEVAFYKKHNYPVDYVGNPTVDAIANYKVQNTSDHLEQFISENKLENKPIIALLAGSRKQEIKDNLPAMLETIKAYKNYQIVLAGAPGIDPSFYKDFIKNSNCKILFNQTYRILSFAHTALVTSGTATLETALFRVPQMVCYKTPIPRIVSWYFKNMMNTPYISLVNLIAGKTVVQELFAKYFTPQSLKNEANKLINGKEYRTRMLAEYDVIIEALGKPGASEKAAQLISASLGIQKK